MGDLEDGWNDWKRLLIDTQRGSLAQHGLDNEGGQRKRGRGRGTEERCGGLKNLECKRFSH